ncbi:MAG: sigma-70 factor domain-containing protein, partial [Acidimicrobiia bacterium]
MGKAIRASDARPERGSSPADTIGLYLDEVSAHLLLTAEDEVHLSRAMELGKKAKATLDSGTFEQSDRAQLMRLVAEG